MFTFDIPIVRRALSCQKQSFGRNAEEKLRDLREGFQTKDVLCPPALTCTCKPYKSVWDLAIMDAVTGGQPTPEDVNDILKRKRKVDYGSRH